MISKANWWEIEGLMDGSIPKPTRIELQKQQLRQSRELLKSAKKILDEAEKFAPKFQEIKDRLTDPQDGSDMLLKLTKADRVAVAALLTSATKGLRDLESKASSVDKAVAKVGKDFERFSALSTKVFDKENGLAAVLQATRKLRKNTTTLEAQIQSDSTKSAKHLTTIENTLKNVNTAYEEFVSAKAKVDDKETGLLAQLRKSEAYVADVLKVKTDAESALVSVTKFKDRSEALVGEIEVSKKQVADYQRQSEELTADLSNVLNKATQFTLSQALQKRRVGLTIQLIIWGIFEFISIVGLVTAVGLVFYYLFIDKSTAIVIGENANGGDIFLTVMSKFFFTTPLIFAVYFTSTNFSNVSNLRDRYAWKETVAKNFQNYVVLLNREFEDEKYDRERFEFSMETIRSIYAEPNPRPKKRRFNFGVNQTLQVGLEEEDLEEIRTTIRTSVAKQVGESVGELAEEVENSVEGVLQQKDETVEASSLKKPKASITKAASRPINSQEKT